MVGNASATSPLPVVIRAGGPSLAALGVPGVLADPRLSFYAGATLTGTNDNWNENVKVIRLDVDQAKARALGVTSQSIAQAIRTLLVGSTVEQFREDNKLIDIVLRQPASERDAITDLTNAYLPTGTGRMIPATQIIKPVFTWEPGVMWREGREYAITVQCDIIEGLQGATVTKELLPQLKVLEAQWAKSDGGVYRIEVAGAGEESSKGSSSISEIGRAHV